MNEFTIIISSIVGLILAFVVGHVLNKKMLTTKIEEAEKSAARILKDSEKEAERHKKEKLLEVKEEWHRKKQKFDDETRSTREQTKVQEKQLKQREESIEEKLDFILKKEKSVQQYESELKKSEKDLESKAKEVETLRDEQTKVLERLSNMTADEAKQIMMDRFVNDAKAAAANKINQIREDAKLNANKEAQKVIVQAIQRTASDHSVETTVSVVNLDSDEMKGRIIGREGRNIRAFEAATGIDLIIDDTPEAVVISGFDPFRREVAKMSLERLMLDGRIHPARIEEVVEKTKSELEEEIFNVGQNACLELSIHRIHPELVKMIGKMKYRSSYGQNLLSHSTEVAYLCGIMAAELGIDANKAKRAGLMHDIGKCVDKNTEGPHALIGYELAKKFKENEIVCNAIGAHHEDIEMESTIAVLVQAADSISGARPGARRESLENYIKRLEKLESIANSFEGVAKTFAIQAGREIRVIVEPEKVDDPTSDSMAESIAERIEAEMEYPGQIKVTVIRERRSVALAK